MKWCWCGRSKRSRLEKDWYWYGEDGLGGGLMEIVRCMSGADWVVCVCDLGTMRGRSSRFFHFGDKPDEISNEGGGDGEVLEYRGGPEC